MQNDRRGRTLLWWTAALCSAAALIIIGGVIPPVRADLFPRAAPQRAATAFWVVAALNLFVAAVFAIAGRRAERKRPASAVLIGMAVGALFLTLLLVDAGLAFAGHGPAMRSTTILIFISAAADLSSAVSAVVAVLLFRRRGGAELAAT